MLAFIYLFVVVRESTLGKCTDLVWLKETKVVGFMAQGRG